MLKKIRYLKLELFLLISLTSFSTLFSQTQFIKEGQCGLALGAGFRAPENATGFQSTIGYSIFRVVDFGMNYLRLNADDKIIANDLIANGINPYIKVYFLHQSKKFPFSTAFGLFIENNKFSGNILDELEWNASRTGFAFGIIVHRSYYASPLIDVIPEVGLFHATHKIRIKDKRAAENILLVEDYEDNIFDFGLNIVFKIKSGEKIYFTPDIQVSDQDNNTFNLSVGFVLPMFSKAN